MSRYVEQKEQYIYAPMCFILESNLLSRVVNDGSDRSVMDKYWQKFLPMSVV